MFNLFKGKENKEYLKAEKEFFDSIKDYIQEYILNLNIEFYDSGTLRFIDDKLIHIDSEYITFKRIDALKLPSYQIKLSFDQFQDLSKTLKESLNNNFIKAKQIFDERINKTK